MAQINYLYFFIIFKVTIYNILIYLIFGYASMYGFQQNLYLDYGNISYIIQFNIQAIINIRLISDIAIGMNSLPGNRLGGNQLVTSQFHNLSLSQLLLQQPTINIYALCLSKSRNESLNQDLAILLEKRITGNHSGDGQKWLQVVRRLIAQDYNSAIHTCIDNPIFMRPLISQLYMLESNNQVIPKYKAAIQQAVLEKMIKRSHDQGRHVESMEVDAMCPYSEQQVRNIQFYLETVIRNNDINALQSIFVRICEHPCCFDRMIKCITQNKNHNRYDKGTRIKLLQSLIQLIYAIQERAMRRMQLNKYTGMLYNRNRNSINQPYISLVQIIQRLLPSILMILQSAVSKQASSTIPKYLPSILTLLSILPQVSALEPRLSSNATQMNKFIEAVSRTDLMALNQYRYLDTELLGINQQIAHHEYSDTTVGLFMAMLINNCIYTCGFYSLYFRHIQNQFNIIQQNLRQSQYLQSGLEHQLINYLLKLSLLSHPGILQNRRADIEAQAQNTANFLCQNWNKLAECPKMQTVRFFIVFVGTNVSNSNNESNNNQNNTIKNKNNGLGVSQAGQSMLHNCLTLCFQCLCSSSSQSTSSQLSPIQVQCHSILISLPEQPHILRLLKRSMMPTLLNLFTSMPINELNLQIMFTYLGAMPQLISRNGQNLLSYASHAFKSMYHSNNGPKPKIGCITKILRIMDQILKVQSQLSYDDIQQMMMPILGSLMHQSHCLHEQQMLNILATLLGKHSHFSPQICDILVQLPQLYNKNEGKLSILAQIYKSTCLSSHIKSQLLYEHTDILMMLLSLLCDYFMNVLGLDQWMFYTNQTRNMLWVGLIFLGQFKDKIIQNQQLKVILVKIYGAINQDIYKVKQVMANSSSSSTNMQAVKLQLYQILMIYSMAVNSIFLHPECREYGEKTHQKTISQLHQSPIQKFMYAQSLKLIPVTLINGLLLYPSMHEQIMTNILTYCQNIAKLELSGGMSKIWKKIKIQAAEWKWDGLNMTTKQYLEGVLRELKNRKQIDQVDYAQYMGAIQTVIR